MLYNASTQSLEKLSQGEGSMNYISSRSTRLLAWTMTDLSEQVSADLLGNDESAELYNKIVEGSMKPRQDLRSLYTYPLFSADDNGLVVSNLEDASDQSQAFEQCLLMYQEAQSSHVVVSSDHGNFLLSSADCV